MCSLVSLCCLLYSVSLLLPESILPRPLVTIKRSVPNYGCSFEQTLGGHGYWSEGVDTKCRGFELCVLTESILAMK